MSQQDKVKWNTKFREKSELLQARKASVYVEKYAHHCGGKKALDLACGSGRHALYLARVGFEVDALDISEVAVESLLKTTEEENLNSLHVSVCDLDTYTFNDAKYDCIIMSNYLNRDLIFRVSNHLHARGIFIIETYMQDVTNEKKDSNSSNLLQAKELLTCFDNSFEVLHYEEFDNESYEMYRMKKQVIVVQKKH